MDLHGACRKVNEANTGIEEVLDRNCNMFIDLTPEQLKDVEEDRNECFWARDRTFHVEDR